MNTSNVSPPSIPYLSPVGLQELPYLITESVLATTLNLYVLIVYFRMKKFTLSNIIFMLLSASDLTLGLISEPFFIINITFISWPLGEFVCHIYQIIMFAQFPVSNQVILVMALHRYFQLTKPFAADERMNKKKAFFLSITWLGPYLYMTALVIVYEVILNTPRPGACSFDFSFTYVLIHDLIFNMSPSLIAIVINVLNVYHLYKKNSVSPNKSGAMTLKAAKMTLAILGTRQPSSTNHESTSYSKSFSKSTAADGTRKSLMRSYSTASKVRRDLKAALCMLFIVLNIVANEYFLNIFWPIYMACPTCYSFTIFFWSIKNIFLFPVINPIIIFIFNESFKREAIKQTKSTFRFLFGPKSSK